MLYFPLLSFFILGNTNTVYILINKTSKLFTIFEYHNSHLPLVLGSTCPTSITFDYELLYSLYNHKCCCHQNTRKVTNIRIITFISRSSGQLILERKVQLEDTCDFYRFMEELYNRGLNMVENPPE